MTELPATSICVFPNGTRPYRQWQKKPDSIKQTGKRESIYFLSRIKKFEVRLPEGYSFADGETTPDFYLSNVHMAAFRYGISAVKEGERAFHDLRQMKHYDPKLDGLSTASSFSSLRKNCVDILIELMPVAIESSLRSMVYSM